MNLKNAQALGLLLFIPLFILLLSAAYCAIFSVGPSMHDQVSRDAALSRVAVSLQKRAFLAAGTLAIWGVACFLATCLPAWYR